MSKSNKLVFFGTDAFSLPSLKALIEADWQIEAIVTKPDRRAGRGRKETSPAVAEIGRKYGIKVLQPKDTDDLKQQLLGVTSNVGVLVSYGRIIPSDVIAFFKHGIVNIHPSLLPKYRGPSPIEAAILNGDNNTGISLMQLVPKMDAGPVYLQKTVALKGTENRISLSNELAELGAELLTASLEDIIAGQLEPRRQDDSAATYTNLLTKADGFIDWHAKAVIIERMVRAYLGYPKTRANLGTHEVILTKVKVVDGEKSDALTIRANDGWIQIEELIAPSGRRMSGAEFLRGYRL